MHLARCLKRRTEAGKHYGVLTGVVSPNPRNF
jgi:hypothetical protein